MSINDERMQRINRILTDIGHLAKAHSHYKLSEILHLILNDDDTNISDAWLEAIVQKHMQNTYKDKPPITRGG